MLDGLYDFFLQQAFRQKCTWIAMDERKERRMRQSLVTATLLINFKKPYEIFLVRADGGEAHEKVFVKHLAAEDISNRAPEHISADDEVCDKKRRQRKRAALLARKDRQRVNHRTDDRFD